MYRDYKSLDDVLVSAKEPKEVPPITILRCAIQGLAAANVKASIEAIFQHLLEKLPWAQPEQDPTAIVSVLCNISLVKHSVE